MRNRLAVPGPPVECGPLSSNLANDPGQERIPCLETVRSGPARMRLRFRHRSEYTYGALVSQNSNDLRFHPISDAHQESAFFLMKVVPSAKLKRFNDLNGNIVYHVDIDERHQSLCLEANGVVKTSSFYAVADPLGVSVDELQRTAATEACHPFVQETSLVGLSPEIWREALDVATGHRDVFRLAVALMDRVHGRSLYSPGVTGVGTTSVEFHQNPRGVCQDYAHLLLAYCRSLLIPARYVGGYLYDARRRDLMGAHASHAWVEVFVPGRGWFGMDPTNRRLAGADYIRVAMGRDYNDAAPVRGSYRGSGLIRMEVSVHLEEA